MSLIRRPDPAVHAAHAARLAARDLVIWTTKDGREIPLDEMSDEHVSNAVRVLALWRTRLKKTMPDDPLIRELADAITRFKKLQRQRAKAAGPSPTKPKTGFQSSRGFGSRPRKPVANT
jgi:hypothetical protein